MVDKCRKNGCSNAGTKYCGACGLACYCTVECQKEDWRVHKAMCVDVNKLPEKLIDIDKVLNTIRKVMALGTIFETEGNINHKFSNSRFLVSSSCDSSF